MENKIIALAGTPNCGKTTFFNYVTGSKSQIGNWPGVTVEKKSGRLKSFTDITVIDLPGTYSLSPYSMEEKVTCDFINNKNFDAIICVIDGTNPEAGIYLALEIISKGIPALLAISYSDDMLKKKISVDTDLLSSMLKIPVFLISSKSGEGINELLSFVENFCIKKSDFMCSEKERRHIADKTVKSCFSFCDPSKNKYSKIDRFLTESRVSVLVFIMLAITIFIFVFGFPGIVLKAAMENALTFLSETISGLLIKARVSETVISLLTDGIISGISSILCFLPQLALIFAFSSVLEDSGYLARIAFVLDKFMRNIGLGGHSVIPVLLGFGCSVPAIMAAKSSHSEKDQLRTVSFLPFVPCGAKLPVYLFLAETIFPGFPLSAVFSVYTISLITGVLFLKFTSKNSDSDFILELPQYRFPSLKSVLKSTARRCHSFISKISTIILISSVIIWFTSYFTPEFEKAQNIEQSIIAVFGKCIEPLFSPMGLSWKALTALIFGLAAKESALSVLNILSSENISAVFNFGSAVSFLIFFTFYSPCFASLSTIKEKYGIKKAAEIFVFQTAFAYIFSFVFYQFYLFITNIFI